jgi:transposase
LLPASFWEKAHVEKSLGYIREWLFVPLMRFAGFDALNG